MAHFRELRVWQLAMQIVEDIHDVVGKFPRAGAGELRSQMVRAAISVASNIAEGRARGSDGDYRRFLSIAQASCSELAAQLEIAWRLRLLQADRYAVLSDRLDHEGRMLNKLIRSLGR